MHLGSYQLDPHVVRRVGFLTLAANLLGSMRGPKYDGKFLHHKIKSLTVTNVIVPAFDVKYMQPVMFSTYVAKADPLIKNAHLSDICISTAAAPTYLPAHALLHDPRRREILLPRVPPRRRRRRGQQQPHHAWPPYPCSPRRSSTRTRISTREEKAAGGVQELPHHISLGIGSPKQAKQYTAPDCADWGMIK
jgi:hypothetical protein